MTYGILVFLGKVAMTLLALSVADGLYHATKDKDGHDAPPWIRNLMICELLAHLIGAGPVLAALYLIATMQWLKKG